MLSISAYSLYYWLNLALR